MKADEADPRQDARNQDALTLDEAVTYNAVLAEENAGIAVTDSAYDGTSAVPEVGPLGLGQPASNYEDDDGESQDESEGSASMSDSGVESEGEVEDEYEPDGADPSHPMDTEGSDEGEYDPEEIQMEEAPPTNVDVEGDAEAEYEPEPSGEMEPAKTPSSQMSVDMVDSPQAETNAATANGAADGNFTSSEVLPEESATDAAETGLSGNANQPPASDEINIELPAKPWQTSEGTPIAAPSPSTQHELLTNSGPSYGTSIAYIPYQSPLSSFQSFRYNEEFQKAVPNDGFRSLTYSNNIDPNVPLCPTELASGACEDSKCEEQHFRHLGLSGMDFPLRW